MVNDNLENNEVKVESNINDASPKIDQETPITKDDVKNVVNEVQNISEPQEKTLKQSEVDQIVGAVKRAAAEKARKEILAELQTSNQNNINIEKQKNNLSQSNIDINDERIRSIIAEENERAANEAIANKIAMEFTQKMMAAKEKYPDFEEVVTQLNLPNVPEIVHWTNSLDNTAEVMYDIAKNPSKFANILMLTHTAPHLAQSELQKLSSSIKKNQEAKMQTQPKEPLSQVNSSTAGIDNKEMGIKDFKRADWLRG